MYAIRSYYASFTYDGTTVASPIVVKNTSGLPISYMYNYKDRGYSSTSAPKDSGHYTVTAKTDATANYNRAEYSVDFEIFKADTLTVIFPRITSYNVCYTKLLRKLYLRWNNSSESNCS